MLGSCDLEAQNSTGELYRSGSRSGSNTVVSEESATHGAALRSVDENLSAPEEPGLASATLDLPSEARFKQLTSLYLLRATYREEEREEDRLSVERVLQSAQRQNAAQMLRLAYMQQQISQQLRITEAREGRLGELLSHLQSLPAGSQDISLQEDAVLQIIGDMNDVRAGSPAELPRFMADAASLATAWEGWNDLDAIPSFYQTCELFVKGQAASVHLQLTPPAFLGRLVSLQEMSSYSPEALFQIFLSYKEPVEAQRLQVASSDPEQAALAFRRSRRLADELYAFCGCFVFGHASSRVHEKPWWLDNPKDTIPLDVMQAAMDKMGLRQDQLSEIQRRWRQHRHTMASLAAEEQNLRDLLRSQLDSRADVTDREGLYLPMMDTVAQLKANRATQASCSFHFDCAVPLSVLEPLQAAQFITLIIPYPSRASIILDAGLMQPEIPPPTLIDTLPAPCSSTSPGPQAPP